MLIRCFLYFAVAHLAPRTYQILRTLPPEFVVDPAVGDKTDNIDRFRGVVMDELSQLVLAPLFQLVAAQLERAFFLELLGFATGGSSQLLLIVVPIWQQMCV